MTDARGTRIGANVPLPFTPELAPANAWYLRGEDNLRLTTFNSLAAVELVVEGVLLNPDGELVQFQRRHVPNTDRTSASTVWNAGSGWLLSLQVRATAATPRRGQCFAVVEVVRGLLGAIVPLATLLQDYVTDTSRAAWPGSPIRASTEGPGVLRSITGTDPAAGAEISETVPTNARWRLHAIQFTLVTGITGATQEVALVLDDGTTAFARVPSGFTQVASTTIVYSSFHHAPRNTAAQDTTKNIPLPRVDLQGGYRITTITNTIGGDDNYGAPQYLVEEWIED